MKKIDDGRHGEHPLKCNKHVLMILFIHDLAPIGKNKIIRSKNHLTIIFLFYLLYVIN